MTRAIISEREAERLRDREAKVQAKAFAIFKEREILYVFKNDHEEFKVVHSEPQDRLDQAFIDAELFVSRCEQRDAALAVKLAEKR